MIDGQTDEQSSKLENKQQADRRKTNKHIQFRISLNHNPMEYLYSLSAGKLPLKYCSSKPLKHKTPDFTCVVSKGCGREGRQKIFLEGKQWRQGIEYMCNLNSSYFKNSICEKRSNTVFLSVRPVLNFPAQKSHFKRLPHLRRFWGRY